ncbi:TetR family transcriptional regulator [Saccharopolyspora sp. NFXS83]|uniref:TetR/AcrR family transcriptional regulator n=1 Tax=Saccharopolyspora sp. NFXS83 TaxID=2993560 RepID=UPI00224B1382|nr:TetR family transcriptional regulator [Saccharopolyspora sp. NFXS83]MCX2731696.1 TetR family transcriptional regulator [Saccharopolyspora sp. NFXS83]
MSRTVTRPHRGVSAADRTAARRARLLAAGRDQIAENGTAGVSVDAVCRRAELTKRYFYESFDGRDTLLVALFDEAVSTMGAALAEALSAAPSTFELRVRAAVRAVLSTLSADRGWSRLWAEAHAHPALRARRNAALDGFVAVLSAELAGSGGGAQDPATTLLVLVAGVTELVERRLRDDLDIGDDALVDQLVLIGVAACAPIRPDGAGHPGDQDG